MNILTSKAKRHMSAAMTRTASLLLAGVSLLLSVAASAADLAVEKLDFAALPGNQMEIRLGFNGTPPDTTGATFAIEKPARISIDLVGAKSRLETKSHNLGTGNARSMTVVEARDRTRVIINLDELVAYTTRIEGNELVVMIGDSNEPVAAVAAAPAPAAAADAGAAAAAAAPASGVAGKVATGRGIAGIDFRRSPDGEGQVVISMTAASIPVDVRQDGDRIVAEFIGASLPENLRRKLDVTDFATPVTSIVSTTSGENVVMVIQPKGDYDYLAYQADKEMIIGVKPVTAQALERKRKDAFVYTGEKLSLNFQDIEVRSVLQLIADFTSLNLVASDTVAGRITLRLQNVPWDQALDLVLKTKALDKRQVGNVLLVAPADEIAARERLELEAYQQSEALAPLRSEFIQINYASAKDLVGLLTSDKSILSSRGSVSVDERTNTMIVVETANKLEEIRELVRRLDVPVRQVLIEARVVLATTDFAKELGVRWGGVQFDGDGLGRANYFTGGANQGIEAGTAFLNGDELEVSSDSLAVDMGVANSNATQFTVGIADVASGILELELSALASDGHGEIVATPKVLTTDQQEALIASGTQIPYQEASSSGATTTAFKDAELKLLVKPHITPDGKIIMDLNINNDSPQITEEGVITIDTNRLQTVVLVNDGDTVVLGGIFKTETVSAVVKTPFLGDLPIIGRLFRNDIRREQKAELLIFITPKIVKELTAKS